MPHTHSTPDKASEIAAIVTRLLSHYWTAAEHAAIRQAQLEDWIEDLVQFELACIRDACIEWRRKPGGKRPTPGEIRVLCLETERTNRVAISGPNAYKIDADMIREWSRPEYDGDTRGWQQRRMDAVHAQMKRYSDAQKWRREHPDLAKPKPLSARDLGVTSAPRSPKASYPGQLDG